MDAIAKSIRRNQQKRSKELRRDIRSRSASAPPAAASSSGS